MSESARVIIATDMSAIYDCTVAEQLLSGMRLARAALSRGELIVMPTDTVYGVAADAFTPAAIQRLLATKGRSRQSPPPVLIADTQTLSALAETVSEPARELIKVFWPGALTIVFPARSSLSWDLGETSGTVALRIPADAVARELLAETGPLAVSSANLTGYPAACTAGEAQEMLGEKVSVYLSSGVLQPGRSVGRSPVASTIVDATEHPDDSSDFPRIRIIRHGMISAQQIQAVIGDALVTGS